MLAGLNAASMDPSERTTDLSMEELAVIFTNNTTSALEAKLVTPLSQSPMGDWFDSQ